MKLHFEPNLDYQIQAIDAVCDLFRGQEICRTEFTVTNSATGRQIAGLTESDIGIGNRLTLLDEEIYGNLIDVQLRSGLPTSNSLTSGDFTVEMETGTGKTYVYIRTIFELNRRYGFTKFVIVVPSIAIKEGVYKTLQITKDHFKNLYSGVPFRYFVYDSAKLGEVRTFATSSNVQIMLVTVGSVNKKDVNNLYKTSEVVGWEKPIDLIRATRPVLIVDEPQSVDGGLEGRGKEALDAMNPLCTLRYSATHIHKHHMVYRLDAVDAYERKLVKQIEVAAATVEGAFNKPFVRLNAIENKKGDLSAKVELDVQTASGIQRREVRVFDGDDLQQTTNRAVYENLAIGEISARDSEKYLELRYPGGEVFLAEGQAHGDVDVLAIQREMIRRTIREHLDKELHLRPLGIKVLSLFFIDEVAKYRQYDLVGNSIKGDYALIFEEEYQRAIKLPAYNTLFSDVDRTNPASDVHNGYFSIDKKGGWTDTSEINAANRENAERAYNLIMKEKEKLLSLETPLKFIFSHSALKEGWDNPNVFQICTLRHIRSERERRQTVGRGLRLCVNSEGDRVHNLAINTLTVISDESYEQFATNLQKEIEAESGIRFGLVEPHQFALISVIEVSGDVTPLGIEQSGKLWEHCTIQGYIDTKGRVQNKLKETLENGSLELPSEFELQRTQIVEELRRVCGRLEIKNADERRGVPLRKTVYLSPEFKALWDRVKYKTTYRVHFDNEKLIQRCIEELRIAPDVARVRLQWRKADIAIGKAGVEATEKTGSVTVFLGESDLDLPDLLTELQDRTQLTRKSIVRILKESGRLDDFRRNPQHFVELAEKSINTSKRMAIISGIKYQKLGETAFYAQELFESEELKGYVKNMLLSAQKSLYEDVVFQLGVESRFAEEMEKNEAVKLYVKLPSWFKIPTPLGNYLPDWAVLIETDGSQRLYFVVETKGGLFTDDLREKERGKISCGVAHFDALSDRENSARYLVATSLDDVLGKASAG